MAHSSRTGDHERSPTPIEPAERRESFRRLGSEVHGGRLGTLWQRLRNPSTKTGLLLIFLAVLLISSPFIPQWIRTTQESLDTRRQAQEEFEASLISQELLIPSQVLPYLNRRVLQMATAERSVDWFAIDFVSGPCSEPHFAQMIDGKYKSALQSGCADIQAIQREYSASCSNSACDIPPEARNELYAAISGMYSEFSDAGLVLPYATEEQLTGP